MLPPPNTFTTTRLLLRPPAMDDAQAIFDGYASDPEVTRYMDWQPHTDVEKTRAFLRICDEGRASGADLTWAVTLQATGELIGMVSCRPDGHKVDIGYVLGRACWGRGYATEAASAVVDWLFTVPEVRRVWATCDVENVASARVLEKLGMTREGVLKKWLVRNVSPEPGDSYVYAKVR